jgi:hypothetical protein
MFIEKHWFPNQLICANGCRVHLNGVLLRTIRFKLPLADSVGFQSVISRLLLADTLSPAQPP